MTTKKPSFLAGLKAAISSPPDFAGKIAALEARLAGVDQERDRAALDVQHDLPGSNVRLTELIGQRHAIVAELETVQAARRAWEAQEAERRASATTAEQERQDRATQAALDHLAAVAKRAADPKLTAAENFVRWLYDLREAYALAQTALRGNARALPVLAGGFDAMVALELGRLTGGNDLDGPPLPPAGKRQLNADPIQPLADQLAEAAALALPSRPKGKAKAA